MMSKITNLQPWIDKSKECLITLEKIDKEDYETKLEWLDKYIESERYLVKNGHYKDITIDKLAIHINSRLSLYNIHYSRNDAYYELFNPEEKRGGGYGTNFESLEGDSHEHKFEATNEPLLKTCKCGRVQFRGLEYDVVDLEYDSDKKDIEKQTKEDKEKADPLRYPESHYFFLVQENGVLLAKLSRALWVKFFDKNNVKQKSDKADIITSAIVNVKDKIAEQKEIQAELKYLLKISDERQKIGQFEKLKALLLMETTYNPSHVANMLGVTDKHLSNTVKAKNKEILADYQDGWFDNIHLSCHVSSCHNMNTYSIGEWVNESLIRKKIGLTLRQPFN